METSVSALQCSESEKALKKKKKKVANQHFPYILIFFFLQFELVVLHSIAFTYVRATSQERMGLRLNQMSYLDHSDTIN